MPASPGQFGFHIMIEGYGAPRQLLSNRVYLYSVLEDLPAVMGMRGVGEPQLIEAGDADPDDPGALSGFVMGAGSRISFNTFPARGYVSAELYTRHCSVGQNDMINLLASSFAVKDAEVFVQNRGFGNTAARRMAA